MPYFFENKELNEVKAIDAGGRQEVQGGGGSRDINVIHFERFYNINQIARYAIISPMSYDILNKSWNDYGR